MRTPFPEADNADEPSGDVETLAEMLNCCPAAVYSKDGYGRWLRVSEGMTSLLGHECRGWVGLDADAVRALQPGRSLLLQRLAAVEESCWQSASLSRTESWLIDHAGEARFVEISCRPSFNEDGSRRMIAVCLTELTRRKRSSDQAEHALGLFSGGPVAVIVWKPEPGWPVSYVSSNIRQVLGYDEDFLLSPGFRYASLIHPDDLAHVAREAEGFLARKERTFEQFYRIRCASGAYRWFYDFTQPHYGDSGQLVEIRGYVLDQTQLKEVQDQLRSHQNQISLISSHVPGMLYTFRPKPTPAFPYVSNRIHDVCGIAPEDVRGDAGPFLRLIHPDDIEGFLCSVRSSVERNADWMRDFRYMHPYKGERWLHASSSPRSLEDGSVVWDGYCFDNTDRVRSEQRLLSEGKRQAIERLAGGIAHDFNNHLAGISLAVDMLHGLPESGPRITEITDSLKVEIQAARSVAKQLLAFTKSQPMELKLIPLSRFLEECLSFALRGSPLTASVAVSPPDSRFTMDPHLLREVLLNLVMNSRQAITGPGCIKLTAGIDSTGRCILCFSDSGPGIPAEVATRLFEPYFTTKPDNSGLGLYVSRSLMRRMGGDLSLDASASGRASFILTLPQVALDADAAPGGETAPRARRSRVLLLEDEAVQARLLRRFFESEGLPFEWFDDGERLLARAAGLRDLGPDLVCLLDISVRGAAGGLDILPRLRAALPDARLLLVSGYSEEWSQSEESCRGLNVHFLAKPYGLDQLREAVFTSAVSSPSAP